jgi:glucose-1-phosphate adenylyltransferase
MGNYIFSARTLVKELQADALRPESRHDFGRDILPSLLGRAAMYAYDYQASAIPGEPGNISAYWRDVGTLEAYYEAHMDLCGLVPSLNLYNRRWPIRTASYPDPSAKFSFDEDGCAAQAIGSIVSGGCVLSGGIVRNSVLGRGVQVHGGAVVENSIILDDCIIGRQCSIRRAILDENITLSDGVSVGHNLGQDRARHHVTETGIVVVSNRSAKQAWRPACAGSRCLVKRAQAIALHRGLADQLQRRIHGNSRLPSGQDKFLSGASATGRIAAVRFSAL